jgi:uncharacterized protein YjbJ (UPF0337 family)
MRSPALTSRVRTDHAPPEKGIAVDLKHKMKNKADQASGKVKETVGKLTDDGRLEAKGRLQHAKGTLAEDAGKLKDSVKHAAGHIRDAFGK